MNGKNKCLYKPPLYKSSGGLLDVATKTTWLFIIVSNSYFNINASPMSVT